MARKMIEREELFQAAESLSDQGKEVTAIALRHLLGRGSLTTVYKYLADWEASRPKMPPAPTAEMPDVVKASFATAWRVAAGEAARETEAIRQRAQEEVAATKKQFEGALELIERVESDLEHSQQEAEDSKAQLAQARENLAKVSSESAAHAATAEQLKNQLVVLLQDAETAQSKLAKLEADRDHAMKEASELRGQVQAMKEQNSELVEALSSKKNK
jgi:hypothetical protein